MNLGGGRGVGSMYCSGSDPTRKPNDAESDGFPAGLRVLVVDDDPTCLKILERMLVTCRYEVTKCNRVDYALNELRSNKNGFDVVISDVHMPNIDGFKLLEYVGLEMDLPVIMMSADDNKNVVMKGVKHGACDYLIKPVRMDALKNIWQHVVRKKKNERQEVEPLDRGHKHDTYEDNWKNSKRKGDEEEGDDRDDYANFKKQRVVWSVELHQQFVAAVNHLGIDKAVPKKILDLMDVPGLTRENVASHLQKYRLCLRKLIGEPHHFGGMNNSFMGPPNSGFGPMTSLGGIDLQTLTAYQPTLASMSMPLHQTNPFGFQTTNFSLSELQQLSNTNRQSYLLHGTSTAMEPKQMNSFYQPLLSTGALVGVLPRNGPSGNDQGMPHTLFSQPSPNYDLTGVIQGGSLDKKRSREFDPNYGLLNDLIQQNPNDWQTGSSSFVGIQNKSFLENRTASTLKKTVFSTDPVLQQGDNIQSGNDLPVDNISCNVKPADTVQEASSASNHYHFEFEQDDLLSVMFNQQKGDITPVEGEFDFDSYALDDLL